MSRGQAITWTKDDILSTRPLKINFSEMNWNTNIFCHLKMSSAKWQPFCFRFDVLIKTFLWRPYQLYSVPNPVHKPLMACIPLKTHKKYLACIFNYSSPQIYAALILIFFLMECKDLGVYLLKRCNLMGIGILIINLRGSDDSLRFIMGIVIPMSRCLLVNRRQGHFFLHSQYYKLDISQ